VTASTHLAVVVECGGERREEIVSAEAGVDLLATRVAAIVGLRPRPRREMPEIVMVDSRSLEDHLRSATAVTGDEARARLDLPAEAPTGWQTPLAHFRAPPCASGASARGAMPSRWSTVARRGGGSSSKATVRSSRSPRAAASSSGRRSSSGARCSPIREDPSRDPQARVSLHLPGCLLLGGYALGSEIAAHGLSGAILAGMVGGALCALALIALVAARWNRAVSPAERERTQQLWARTRPIAVSLGVAGAGIAAAVGAIAGNGAQGLGSALMAAIGVVFVAGAAITAAAALGRRGLFS
jgi:hypothetical protein